MKKSLADTEMTVKLRLTWEKEMICIGSFWNILKRSTVIFSSLLNFVDLQNHCQSGACRFGAYYLSRLVEHLGHLP
ncbi:hypothetical protein BDL97_05G104800 [Sphagnum fallax]|nr:hypothetical protein BDL97_05G104800 [Sphagnum fallax]